MKKVFFAMLLLFILFFSVDAQASTPRTTLQYYSPSNGSTINGDTVTFQWNIHCWDEVKKVTIILFKPNESPEYFSFNGNEAKRRKHTVTGLKPKTIYYWHIRIDTTKESGSFGLLPGFSFITEWVRLLQIHIMRKDKRKNFVTIMTENELLQSSEGRRR